MNRVSQAKNRRLVGFIFLVFGIFFTVFVVGMFTKSSMSYEKHQIQSNLSDEFGAEVEIEFNDNFFSEEENVLINVVKYMFAIIGLIIVGVGIYLIYQSYKIEKYERENMNNNFNPNINMNFNPYINQNNNMGYNQNNTINLNGKIYNKDDNSLSL